MTGITGDDAEKKTKAEPGWYHDKRWKYEERRWDGEKWLDDWRPTRPSFSERPDSLLLSGLLLAVVFGVIAGVCFSVDDSLGWFMVWLGSGIAGVIFTIGMIGKGVEIGIRAGRR